MLIYLKNCFKYYRIAYGIMKILIVQKEFNSLDYFVSKISKICLRSKIFVFRFLIYNSIDFLQKSEEDGPFKTLSEYHCKKSQNAALKFELMIYTEKIYKYTNTSYRKRVHSTVNPLCFIVHLIFR